VLDNTVWNFVRVFSTSRIITVVPDVNFKKMVENIGYGIIYHRTQCIRSHLDAFDCDIISQYTILYYKCYIMLYDHHE